MKILHTADWHLGKRLDFVSRHPEQVEVMDEICEIAKTEQVDVVIVAGDLFDNINPPVESIELLYKTLKRLSNNGKTLVIALAGNHDSPDRINTPDPLARECGIVFVGYPNAVIPAFKLETGLELIRAEAGFAEFKLPGHTTPLRVLLTPYANEIRLRKYLGADNPEETLRQLLQDHWQQLSTRYLDDNGVNILTAHLYVAKKGEELPEEPEDEKSILSVGNAQVIYSENLPPGLQYVALGHLHRRQTIDKRPYPVVYSSSPLAYSFNETNQQKFVVLVEAEAGKEVNRKNIPIQKGKRLLRSKFNSIDDAVEWLTNNQESLVEITITSDTYLTAEERRRLNKAHDGIINIIPEIRFNTEDGCPPTRQIDLNMKTEDLFVEYFKSENKNQNPSDELMALFREIMKDN